MRSCHSMVTTGTAGVRIVATVEHDMTFDFSQASLGAPPLSQSA